MHPAFAGTTGLGPHPKAGDAVGRYVLGPVLGTGGMATVFRAAEVPGGAAVALKVLNPARVAPEDVKRFTREFKALSRMDHANVVRVYEAGVHQGYPWIALELVEGHDLEAELQRWKEREPKDRWKRVTRILRGLCHGLAYVHELGLVHRDLKPSNVLLTAEGEPKITDFGVVKTDNTHSTQLTMAGRLVGTVAYMAPELITDEGVDRRTDLYALGAILYLMCTHRRPIEADSVAGYLARHLTEVPRPVGELEPACPAILERICARLLQKDRTFRYPSASAVLAALERPEDPELPPLRGRDELQVVLGQRISRLTEGGGALLGLVGPDGAGKTHVLRALVEQAAGLRALMVRIGGSLPLAAALELALPDDRRRGLDRLLHVLQREPVLLAVDDLDHDPLVAAELAPLVKRALALEGRPLLVAFTAASLEGLRGLVEGDAGVTAEVVTLGPIDAKAALTLLRDRGLQGPIAAVLARRLHTEFGGLPGGMVSQLQALLDHAWLRHEGDQVRPTRPADDFRKAELPVPEETRSRVLHVLDGLSDAGRSLCEFLAVLARSGSVALLERSRPDRPDLGREIERLVASGFLDRTREEDQEVVQFRDPGAGRVIRSELDPDRKRALHAAIADALGARKRRLHNALEVATHLEAAGEDALALPLYVQAARRSAREGRITEVLDLCDAGDRCASRCASAPRAPAAPSRDTGPNLVSDFRGEPRPESAVSELDRNRRWLFLLRGEALLARRSWDQAVPPLQSAVLLAEREGDAAGVARARGSLGRAHYRAGRLGEAEPLLRDALARAEEGAPERASALRALGDIAIRAGRFDEAGKLWSEARDVAQAMGSKDALARARRGLAHLRAIEGDLEGAATLLREAEDLLVPEGDVRVRAGVLARGVELDTALGRFGAGLYRARQLVDLLRQHGLSERLPEAYVLVAEILVQVGDVVEALDAAHQCIVYAKAASGVPPMVRLRVARVFCDLRRPDQARLALPALEELVEAEGQQDRVHDPAGQLAAVRARVHAAEHPARARDLATWALTRTPPLLVLAAGRIATDAARALLEIGQPLPARTAVKHGLKVVGASADGLRLELLVTMQAASPDPRVEEALRGVAQRVLAALPTEASAAFRGRSHIGAALGR